MPTYQAPRGMRDLLPAEAAALDALQAVVQARALRYGYPRIVTPVVENAEVFRRTVGETSDVASKEMFDVSLHGTAGGAPPPPGTPPGTPAHPPHRLHRAPPPPRVFYSEPMFPGQRPPLLPYPQVLQCG